MLTIEITSCNTRRLFDLAVRQDIASRSHIAISPPPTRSFLSWPVYITSEEHLQQMSVGDVRCHFRLSQSRINRLKMPSILEFKITV